MRCLPVVVLLLSSLALAEEGMWLFNDFPTAQAKKDVGFGPDQAWLDRVRLGSLRLANGCSASHRLARRPGDDQPPLRARLPRGSLHEPSATCSPPASSRPSASSEERCPKFEGNQLLKITDVTEPVLAATKGVERR